MEKKERRQRDRYSDKEGDDGERDTKTVEQRDRQILGSKTYYCNKLQL